MNRRRAVVASAASAVLAASCGSVSSGAAASPAALQSAAAPASGHVVVADNGGTLWDINPATGAKRVLSTNAKSKAAGGAALFQDVFGVTREANGNFVVIARLGSTATTSKGPHSRVIRVNAKTGAQSLIVSNSKLHYSLTSVGIARSGEIYIGDENAPSPPYNDSVVYGANPRTGQLRVVTSDAKSVAAGGIHRDEFPLGLATAPDGTLFVLADSGGDDRAPANPNDFVGAIISVNPATGRQTFFTSNYYSKRHGGGAYFADPRSFVRAPNGDFFVVDDAAINLAPRYNAGDTKVIRVDGDTGAQTLVSNNQKSKSAGANALFDRPYGIAIQSDGQLLVTDGDRLLRVNPKTGAQSLVTKGLGTAIGIVAVP